jgi:predicted dehydrogenase
MGRAWGATLAAHPDVTIAGWVDLQADVAAAAVAEVGAGDVWIGSDLDRALRDVRPHFVVDVTIPEAHHDVTIAALGAGVPVLGEKPMADTIARAQAMITAER